MSKKAKILDSISGYFFLGGFVLSKFAFIPILLVASIFNIAALGIYFIGYVAWFLAGFFHPDHPKKSGTWYGFAPLRYQNIASALVGIVATAVCFLMPAYIMPALWLFMLSNTIWLIAEVHRLKHPPAHETEFSSKQQIDYLKYAGLITVISTISALAITLTLALPHIAAILVLTSTIVTNAITVIALYYRQKSAFNKYEPDAAGSSSSSSSTSESYKKTSEQLGNNPHSTVDEKSNPHEYTRLLAPEPEPEKTSASPALLSPLPQN